jgi:large subunit ribosomal protein L32e
LTEKKPVRNRKAEKIREKIKAKKKPVFRGRFGKKQTRRKSNEKWDKWRRPRGIDITRKSEDGAVVDIGYRTERKIRGLHPSGMKEVMVCTPAELGKVSEGCAARISGTVGKKKKADIVKTAESMNIKVLNG